MYGLTLIAVIAITGGIIAYLGDRIGMKIGKKRLTLFGLRPRYTSIVITIITGVLISAGTIAVLTVISEDVRTALFQMREIKTELVMTKTDLSESQEELRRVSSQVEELTDELRQVTGQIESKTIEFQELSLRYDELVNHYEVLNIDYSHLERQYEEIDGQLRIVIEERDKAEKELAYLEEEIQNLNEELELARADMEAARVIEGELS